MYSFNYKITLVEDACRGVDRNSIEATKNELLNAGANIVTSKELIKSKK